MKKWGKTHPKDHNASGTDPKDIEVHKISYN